VISVPKTRPRPGATLARAVLIALPTPQTRFRGPLPLPPHFLEIAPFASTPSVVGARVALLLRLKLGSDEPMRPGRYSQ
jgi:hypothetical protein